MKSLLRFLSATAGLLALFAAPQQAQAASTVMCAANAVAATIARTIGGAGSSMPSGTLYSLNGQGCTVVLQADVGYFLSQGFSAGPPFGPNIIYTTGVITGTAAVQIGTLPPSTYIQHIIINNTNGTAPTGALTFGSTSGAPTDIVATFSGCSGANCLVFIPDATLAKRVFSTTAATQVWMGALTTGFASTNLTVTVVYGYF